jgi:phage shock protein A
MKESMASRVSRLIAGSVNKVIDAVENSAPEMVMEQALREVDRLADDVRAELGKVIAARHLATKRLMDESRKHEALGEQVELAVAQAREDLAEAAIARQFDIEAQLPILEAAISDAAAKQKELEGYAAALAARRREMQDDLVQYRAELATGVASPRRDAVAKPGEARREATRDEATSPEYDPARSMPHFAARLAELDALARRNRIRERLEQVKAKTEK